MPAFPSAYVSSPSDLLCIVAERPEDLVALRGWRAAKKGFAKIGIHVFPNNLTLLGDFEKAAEGRLGDQRIAVWQALSVPHARREKVPGRALLILPCDLVCA